jgi:hypothetical protein
MNRNPVTLIGKKYKRDAAAKIISEVNSTFLLLPRSSHCPASGRDMMADSKNTVVINPA